MTHSEQPDLDTLLAEIKAMEAERKAKAERMGDPHAMHNTVSAVFAKVDRQRRIDQQGPNVEIKVYEC